MPIKKKLRPYQVEVGRAVMESILGRKGLTFTVEMARQGGKNELSAQLEVLLLTFFMGAGGYGVKCSPTFKPQTLTSMMRLKERLNEAGFRGLWRTEQGYLIRMGKARMAFYSADKSSNVVGATAHLILEVDEAQDVDEEKYLKEFRPMGASTNVTTVLYGTAWDDSTLLERTKQVNLELEGKDGARRHFEYDWQVIAQHNPDYLRFVEAERQRLGENHPLFQTQYCLHPLHGGGGFLSPTQCALMQGSHLRLNQPPSSPPLAGRDGAVYVAGVDVAGEAEMGEDEAIRQLKPSQDSTVVTVAKLAFSPDDEILGGPKIEVVEHYWWTGTPHTQLYSRLVALLKDMWRCRRVVVDATGVGAGLAGFLEKALGKAVVRPFLFTAQSKSLLGFSLLAAVNSGRLRLYAPDGSPEYQECRWELERARSIYRPNQTMNFFVNPREGHDDFLVSLALAVAAAEGYTLRKAQGRNSLSFDLTMHI